MGVLNVIGVTAVLLLFFISMHLSEAGRMLHNEEENSTTNKLFVLMESKQNAVHPPPDGPNPRTNMPSPTTPPSGHAASTINQRNFAGHTTIENSTTNKLFVLMESKQKAVHPPPDGHNEHTGKPGPATPTSGHAASTINQRNFAGHTTIENSMTNKLFVLMESKQKAVHPPPDGHNEHTGQPGPATPTSGHAASTINQRNFAGHPTIENSTTNKLFVLTESKQKAVHPPPDGPNPHTNMPSPTTPPSGHAA
ncbi:uncharacterized protein LOC133737394 [Rosa rugosa]|uniref:uncharacterized protein LOC133737394 n=1 Tax=Rosa rugosa TaxID=74645 RepID=UPI002B41612A|nr:uncharacterized protein LOC133737394 [Rosa rugosa]